MTTGGRKARTGNAKAARLRKTSPDPVEKEPKGTGKRKLAAQSIGTYNFIVRGILACPNLSLGFTPEFTGKIRAARLTEKRKPGENRQRKVMGLKQNRM
jgi:hypothetical protein